MTRLGGCFLPTELAKAETVELNAAGLLEQGRHHRSYSSSPTSYAGNPQGGLNLGEKVPERKGDNIGTPQLGHLWDPNVPQVSH